MNNIMLVIAAATYQLTSHSIRAILSISTPCSGLFDAGQLLGRIPISDRLHGCIHRSSLDYSIRNLDNRLSVLKNSGVVFLVEASSDVHIHNH